MRALFDLGHPAHVHLFRCFVDHLRRRGDEVTVTSRDKEVTVPLLDHYGIPHRLLSRPAAGRLGMARELVARTRAVGALHRRHRFEAAFGTSASIGWLTLTDGVPSYNFNEDDDDVVPLYAWLAYPPATAIVNPDCLRFRRWRGKRLLHPSYHELAYLHPDRFTPDPEVPRRHGLEPGRYAVVRLSALAAHHDRGARGLSAGFLAAVDEALGGLAVVRSAERETAARFAPWELHDLLAFARLIVSDSQTMTIEAAVLGVPAVRVNSFVGRSTVLAELEGRYRLALGFPPEDAGAAVAAVRELAAGEEVPAEWQRRRRRMLADKVDLTAWMIDRFAPGGGANIPPRRPPPSPTGRPTSR